MKPKPQSAEYKAFENLLGKVLTVSKAELNQRIEKEKQEKNSSNSQMTNPPIAERAHQSGSRR
jgi:hypothetical protein